MENKNLCCIVNLPERKDRHDHIVQTFKFKDEFDFKVYSPLPQNSGSYSLWITIKKIIKTIDTTLPFFILCEDDHEFTPHYSFDLLKKCINEAEWFDADIICAGVSWFKTGILVSKNLFWVEKFSGLQFTIIFKKFYKTILEASFAQFDQADYRISELTEKKFVIYPFMSIQKDFGYSDVTRRNNEEKIIQRLFKEASERFFLLKKVKSFYSTRKISAYQQPDLDVEQIDLPLYLIADTLDDNSCSDIISNEFNCNIIPITISHYLEQWKALCECIDISKRNTDDFIIIAFDSFDLAIDFKRVTLVNYILAGSYYSCDILLGNVQKFNHAVPVNEFIFWVDSFSRSSFIVLYAKAYEKILSNPPIPDEVSIYNYLSYITSNKMAVYPFVSQTRCINKENETDLKFQEHGNQLAVYQKVFRQFL